MITVTIADILNSEVVLRKLTQQNFKARLAWQITRILKNMETEIQNFHDARNGLIQKYGELDEHGHLIIDDKGNSHIRKEELATFNKEMEELLSAKVDINGEKIKLEDLENCDFTPQEMSLLEALIEE